MFYKTLLLAFAICTFPYCWLFSQPTPPTTNCSSCNYTIADTVSGYSISLAAEEVLCILPSGYLTGSWNIDMVATAEVVNCGVVDISGDIDISAGSLVNRGSLSCSGDLNISAGVLANYDYLFVNDDITISDGSVDFFNLDTVWVVDNTTLRGDVVHEGYWYNGGNLNYPSGNMYSETASLLECDDLSLFASVQGPTSAAIGCLSIVASGYTTVNTLYGMSGAIDICDLSPPPLLPLALDALTGILGGNISHCECNYSPDGYSVLPVELLSFEANGTNSGVELNWSTALEIDNKGFEVYRSSDGEFFERIGFVQGAGNSTVTNHYQFHESLSKTGISYYRLKQLDYSGEYTWSELRAVEVQQGIQEVSVYPNPTQESIHISGLKGPIDVTVISTTGIVFKEKEIGAEETKVISLKGVPAGLYFVQVEAMGRQQIESVVKH